MISKKNLALSKMFMSRTTTYLALINSGMILFLVLSKSEDYGIDIEIEKYFIPIIILGLILLSLFGWLEDKLGFHELEKKHVEDRNPYLREILERIKKIEKNIK